MARIRSIKPEFWADEKLATVSRDARLLFIGMWNLSDDEGRLRGSHLFIRAHVFPYDLDVDVERCLAELERVAAIQRYLKEAESYIWVRNFNKHQRLDKRLKSVLPAPPPHANFSEGHANFTPASQTAPSGATPVHANFSEEEQGAGSGEEQGAGGVPASAERVRGPVVFEAPTSPPEAWTGDEFWRWFQVRRQAAGLLAETRRSRPLGPWWNQCLMTPGVTVQVMKQAVYAFGKDKHWESADPPFPFNAFASQWDKYASKEVARAAAS